MPELNQDYIVPGIAKVAPELVSEAEKAKEADGDDVFTLAELDNIIASQGKEDPGELIRDRFLCKKGAVILAAQTGCGKSSFVMQMIFNFALGRSYFGLTPAKELKTLLIQGENDQRDLYEEVSGVCRGLANHELIGVPQLEQAKQAVTVRTCTNFSGHSFIAHLDNVLTHGQGDFDLLVIDPLFSFIGADIGKEQGIISQWLRNGLNTVLRTHNIGAFIVHHTNKPSKTLTPEDQNFNSAYAYAGSAELANWARGILVLERFTNDTSCYFRLTAPKRGTRITPNFCKYLEWAKDGGIYWLETQPPSIPANAQEKRELEKQQKLLTQAREAANYLEPGEVISKTAFIERLSGKMLISSKDARQTIVNICIEQGFIIQRTLEANEHFGRGVCKVVTLPETHSGQVCDNERTQTCLDFGQV